jgi:tRNA (cytidine/uridine-2'-O-)-methyltransferase
MMRLALYQPDIPQNTGTIMRLCAGLGVALDIIEPCGFVLNDKNLKRAGMDYLEHLDLTRHISWDAFLAQKQGRLILMENDGAYVYSDFSFQSGDILLAGRESAGVPADVAKVCAAVVKIPMTPPARSLNVAVASGIILGEALRQTRWSKKT